MGAIIDCYGHSYQKRTDCDACQLADYCKDAGDIPLLGHNQLIESITPTIQTESEDEDMETTGIISIFDRIAENPTGWKMIKETMFNGYSLAEAAGKCGLHSKQAGHYHAQSIFRKIETCFDAWDIKYRHYQSKYWTEKPAWLKRIGNSGHSNLF